MDKQSLKKHHFWILLGLSVPLVLIVLAGTVFGVGSAAVEAKAKIDKRNKELTSAAPKCQQYLDKLDEQKTELEKQRNKVWEEVYKAQAGLIRWPDRLNQLDRLYFGDKLGEDYRTIFRETDVYLGEYKDLPSIIAPTQFLSEDWTRVLRHVADWQKLPSSEDCWLALENLCVQREILRDIHAVNQLLAQFLPVPQPLAENATPEAKAQFEKDKANVDRELRESLKLKDGEVAGRFLSPYWVLDLAVTRSASGKPELIFRGKLTNISDRRQNVSRINFKVWMDPASQPAVVPVEAEFLAAGESLEFADVRVPTASRANRIHAVEQVLDLRYAPVKRVDRLVLGYLSNRYADQKLVGPEGPAFKEARDAEGAGAAPAAAPIEGAGRMAGAGGSAAPSGPSSTSSNGLERDRYLHRTEQVRRMPIGLVLVVDQAHIQDVQRAFANSRLRFQNVQIHWQRFRGTLDGSQSGTPTMSTAPSTGSGAPGLRPAVPSSGGAPTPARPNSGGGASGGTDPGTALPGRPSGAPPAPGSTAPGGLRQLPDEAMTSLVEVSIYGIASLYERFPPRHAAPLAAGTTQDAGTVPPAALPPGSPPAPVAGSTPQTPAIPPASGQSSAPPPPPTPPTPPPIPPDGR